MDRKELEKQIQAGKVNGVYLLDGTDEYLKQRALKNMISCAIGSGMEELNLSNLNNPSTNELIAACETIPFMSEKRVVVVRDAPYLTDREDGEDKLKDYLIHVPVSTVLIFFCHGKTDSRKSFVKGIEKTGAHVCFSPMTEGEVNLFIREAFREQGKVCSNQVASQLAFVAGSDTSQLMNEIGKLTAYAGERKEIAMEDIDKIVTRSTEFAAFAIVNAVMENREARAFALMRDMLAAGESRISILAMIERQFRMIQHTHIMKHEKKTQEQMLALLGVKSSYVVNIYLQQTRQIPPALARDSVKLCVDTEYGIKSGRLNQEGALEALLLKLFEMRRTPMNG